MGKDRDALIEDHLPLVKRVWSRLRIGLPPQAAAQLEQDLLSAGAMGLVQAADRFSEAGAASFATFASWRIRGAMLDELRRHDWLTKQARRRLKEIQRAFARLEQEKGRPATEEEAARELGTDAEALRQELVEIGPATLVFLEGLGGHGGESADWKSFIADPSGFSPEEQALKREMLHRLAEAVGRLPDQDRRVLSLLIESGLGQGEIADVMGVSPSRVSQIYARAVARLQGALLPLFEGANHTLGRGGS